jgi:enamine deaminase RidA (YjgF/YER057c/UK114 family)
VIEEQSRRNLLKNAAKAAVVAGGLASGKKMSAQTAGSLEKRDAKAKPGAGKPKTTPLYTDVVAYGNLLFVAGKSQHLKGTIEEHTAYVIDLLEKNLVASGSSLRKVLKVNVYLKNMAADVEKMNEVYRKRDWGDLPPARTTTSSPGGFPGADALIMMDMMAYV